MLSYDQAYDDLTNNLGFSGPVAHEILADAKANGISYLEWDAPDYANGDYITYEADDSGHEGFVIVLKS